MSSMIVTSLSLLRGGLMDIGRDDLRLFRLHESKDVMLENLDSALELDGFRDMLREELTRATNGTIHFLSCGKSMGKFVTRTATKVSRTAQEPASWAPLMGP